MDVDMPLSAPLFSYPSQSSQIATQCLPGATSTAVVDYADTLRNSQPAQIKTEPSYDKAPAGPIHEPISNQNWQASFSWLPNRPVKLSRTSDSELLAYLARRRISPRYLRNIDIHVATEFEWLRGALIRSTGGARVTAEGRESTGDLNATQIEALKVYATGTPLKVYQLGAATCKGISVYENRVLDPDVKIPNTSLRRGVGLLHNLKDPYWTVRPEDVEDFEELSAFMKMNSVPKDALGEILMTIERNNSYLIWKKDLGGGSKITRSYRMLASLCQNGNPVDVVKWVLYHLDVKYSKKWQDAGYYPREARRLGSRDMVVRDILRSSSKYRGDQTDRYTPSSPNKLSRRDDNWRPSYDDSRGAYDRPKQDPTTRDIATGSNLKAIASILDTSLQNVPICPRADREGTRISRRRQHKLRVREEDLQKRKVEQIVMGAPHPEASIQDHFARLTVTDLDRSGTSIVRPDRLGQFQHPAETSLCTTKKFPASPSFADQGNRVATSGEVTSCRQTAEDAHGQYSECSASELHKPKILEALNNKERMPLPKTRAKRRKSDDSPMLLAKRLVETEKQIVTLEYSSLCIRKRKRKLENLRLEALRTRVKIEKAEGRITAEEAQELMKANGKAMSRRNKKMEHKEGLDSLVNRVKML
ncbi:hypothetical protein MMC11_001670 [Xylographa trunciseda]|nr:hypothetical protein [Xylographa trunciseda]